MSFCLEAFEADVKLIKSVFGVSRNKINIAASPLYFSFIADEGRLGATILHQDYAYHPEEVHFYHIDSSSHICRACLKLDHLTDGMCDSCNSRMQHMMQKMIGPVTTIPNRR